MSEHGKLLITKLVRTSADRADLFGRGHQYKDLTLFDISDLADVGIEYEDLPIGQETPCRFWALYTESEKLNQSGNPYKDVVGLEAIDRPAQASSGVSDGAVLEELRGINERLDKILLMLEYAANGRAEPRSERPETGGYKPPPANETLPDEPPAAPPAKQSDAPPLDDAEAKRQFFKLTGPSIQAGKIDSGAVNELIKQVSLGNMNWGDALRQLTALVG
jgi:hypothetical protein